MADKLNPQTNPQTPQNPKNDPIQDRVDRVAEESRKCREMVDADRKRYLDEIGPGSGTSPFKPGSGPKPPISPEEAGRKVRGEDGE